MNNNQDERVLTQKRKVQSDGFQLLIIGLLLSCLIQQFLLNAPPSQYAGEFILFLGASIYIIYNSINLGYENAYSNMTSNKRLFRTFLITGLASALVSIVITGDKNIESILSSIIIFISVYGGGTYFLSYLSKRKKDEIERELDMDEDNIE